jgi:inhibitor of cysteine peptidase
MREHCQQRQGALALATKGAVLVALGLSSFPGLNAAPLGVEVSARGHTVTTITLTRTDNDTTKEVHVGVRIVVQLPENPTTGYSWEVDSSNDRIIRLRSSVYSHGSPDRVGGGGERSFTFEAMGVGTDEIRLKNWRKWQGEQSIAERFVVTVRVLQESAQP